VAGRGKVNRAKGLKKCEVGKLGLAFVVPGIDLLPQKNFGDLGVTHSLGSRRKGRFYTPIGATDGLGGVSKPESHFLGTGEVC